MLIKVHDKGELCLINIKHIVKVGMTMPFYPENKEKLCTITLSNGQYIYPEESVEECAKLIRLMTEKRK